MEHLTPINQVIKSLTKIHFEIANNWAWFMAGEFVELIEENETELKSIQELIQPVFDDLSSAKYITIREFATELLKSRQKIETLITRKTLEERKIQGFIIISLSMEIEKETENIRFRLFELLRNTLRLIDEITEYLIPIFENAELKKISVRACVLHLFYLVKAELEKDPTKMKPVKMYFKNVISPRYGRNPDELRTKYTELYHDLESENNPGSVSHETILEVLDVLKKNPKHLKALKYAESHLKKAMNRPNKYN